MDAVCSVIPETHDDLDLGCTGYHIQCNQPFHTNMHRLKGAEASDEGGTLQEHHSHRKGEGSRDTPLFPAEYIFDFSLYHGSIQNILVTRMRPMLWSWVNPIFLDRCKERIGMLLRQSATHTAMKGSVMRTKI